MHGAVRKHMHATDHHTRLYPLAGICHLPLPCPLQDSPLSLYLRGPLARQVAQVKDELLAGPKELQQELAAAVDDFYERLQGIPELLGLDLGPKSEGPAQLAGWHQ
jgi:hypothetical protein